jgi:hypothetical protein
MGASSSLRRLANSVLPRPVVERLSALAADRQRRSNARKLTSAPERFDRAYAAYWKTGVVPPDAEELLFLATWSSAGTWPHSRVPTYGRPFDPDQYRIFPDELLDVLDTGAMANSVERDGFYVVPHQLPAEVVDDILAVLDEGPAQPRGDGLGRLPLGPPRPVAPTWWVEPVHTMRSTAARRLLKERRLAEAAGRYLGVDPMIMSVVLWKSFAWSAPDKSSAQHFHYDNDRAAFVKTFVYLTDVGMANGPHVYVPGSHREKPRELMHGQRLSDEAVARYFPRDEWKTIVGGRGTVFFADTQGFHKGGHVAEGERAMFQINLASDRFGIGEPPIATAADAPAELAPMLALAPRYFSQLYTPEHLGP